jgi:bisphosphoglycerate-independent phosphoglycerate mutase (AlkP superfamily)
VARELLRLFPSTWNNRLRTGADKGRDGGNLSDIAPTILTLMNEKIPEEMTGKNLIIN